MKKSVCIIMMAVFTAVAACLSIVVLTDSLEPHPVQSAQEKKVEKQTRVRVDEQEIAFSVEPIKVVAQATLTPVQAAAQPVEQDYSEVTASVEETKSQQSEQAAAVPSRTEEKTTVQAVEEMKKPTVEDVRERFEEYVSFAKQWIYNKALYENAVYGEDGRAMVEAGTQEIPDVKTLRAEYAKFFAPDNGTYDFFSEYVDKDGKLWHTFCDSCYNPEQNIYLSDIKQLADGTFEVIYLQSYEGFSGIDFTQHTISCKPDESGEWLFHKGTSKQQAEVDYKLAFQDYIDRYSGSDRSFCVADINGDEVPDLIVSVGESNCKEVVIFRDNMLTVSWLFEDEVSCVEGESILVGTSTKDGRTKTSVYNANDYDLMPADIESGAHQVNVEKLTVCKPCYALNQANAQTYIFGN